MPDWLRATAIVLMVIFHLVFDLAYYYNWPLDYLNGFWLYWQQLCASLFILVSGMTAQFKPRRLSDFNCILVAALLISGCTYFLNSANYIRFGILHFLYVSNVLHVLLLRHIRVIYKIFIVIIIYLIAPVLYGVDVEHSWFIAFNILPQGFVSLDHYPLLPWLGLFLLGTILSECTSIVHINIPRFRGVTWLSKHSLAIYLLHQPLLLLVLLLFLGTPT